MHCILFYWLYVGILLCLAEMAVSLKCETCRNLENQTCAGSLETCKPQYEKCAVALSKSLTEQSTIVKTCVSSSLCETHLKVLNAGKEKKILTKIFCCSGNECKNISYSFPPINVTLNGKKCAACYYWGNRGCPEKTVECSGEEIYCLELFGTGDTGRHVVSLTVKGCANQATCDGFVKGPLSMGGVIIGGKAKCTPASRIEHPIPRLFGLTLLLLIVLLPRQVLP